MKKAIVFIFIMLSMQYSQGAFYVEPLHPGITIHIPSDGGLQKPHEKQKRCWAPIVGFICGVFGLGIAVIPAILISAIGMNRKKYRLYGFAIAGLILGIFWLVITIALVAMD